MKKCITVFALICAFSLTFACSEDSPTAGSKVGVDDGRDVPESVLLGDVNQDGRIDVADNDALRSLLATSEYLREADINEDGEVNFFDLAPFEAILNAQ